MPIEIDCGFNPNRRKPEQSVSEVDAGYKPASTPGPGDKPAQQTAEASTADGGRAKRR